MNGVVPGTSSWRYPFPGHFGAKSVRKYPKSAENETNNDRTEQEVLKTRGLYEVRCWEYSGGKSVPKWKL